MSEGRRSAPRTAAPPGEGVLFFARLLLSSGTIGCFWRWVRGLSLLIELSPEC
jgi:hypothetical protein